MHIPGKRARRFVSVLGSVVVAGPLAATMTGASANASPAAPVTPIFTLHGSIAGRIKLIQPDQALTFSARVCPDSENNGAVQDSVRPLRLSPSRARHIRVAGPRPLPPGG
jgi:hypothetical protein